MDEVGEGGGLHGLADEVGEHVHDDLEPGERWALGEGLHVIKVGEGGGLRRTWPRTRRV